MFYEALQQLALKLFLESHANDDDNADEVRTLINTFSLDIGQETFDETLGNHILVSQAEQFEAYTEGVQQRGGDLGADSILRRCLIGIGNPIVEIRRSDDRPISTM